MSRRLEAERLLQRTLLAPMVLALALALLGVLLLALWSGPADAATTFTVNRTGDAGDRRISDNVCDTSRKNGRQCTLRAAIQESNDTSGADKINFNIGGDALVKTISPASPLPDITEAVTINGYSQPGASANTLATGNDAVLKIELNGTNAGGRFTNGIKIETSRSIIKGLVINRFFDDGVRLEGGAAGNRIEGNFIGTNAAGSEALANGNAGVFISRALNNTVGGIQPAQRNVISGNGDEGVAIDGSGATGNKVLGNFIGTTANGSEALGNGGEGVFIFIAPNNTVGGTTSGARNVISGNGNRGITIFAAAGNKVEGNRIGTKADGSGGLGNDGEGVLISSGASNTVGGTASGAGNRIAHNGKDGVSIFESVGNSVLSNSIFSNGELGIDLSPDGVTANDTDDPDTGANNLQNFPVITSVTQSSQIFNPTRISGTLNSNPSQEFTVQCFLAGETPEDADPSGHGEGRAFMAEDIDVSTDVNGDASFQCDFLFPASLEGKRWSATATNEATGDTSEFSANFAVS